MAVGEQLPAWPVGLEHVHDWAEPTDAAIIARRGCVDSGPCLNQLFATSQARPPLQRYPPCVADKVVQASVSMLVVMVVGLHNCPGPPPGSQGGDSKPLVHVLHGGPPAVQPLLKAVCGTVPKSSPYQSMAVSMG